MVRLGLRPRGGGKGTYEARRVVIFHSLGVSEGLENGIRLEQLLLQLALVGGEEKEREQ